MHYTISFDSYERAEKGEQPEQARVFGALRLAFTLRPESGGQALGGGTDLAAALEWSKLMHLLSDDDFLLRPEGGIFYLSAATLALIRTNWKAVRDHLGVSLAEDIEIMERFLREDTGVRGASLVKDDPNDSE